MRFTSIEVESTTANIDPIATPGAGAIQPLMLFVPYNDPNLSAPRGKTILVSDVAMTVDVYACDDATIPTGSDTTPTAAVLGKRKFYIAQTAITFVPNTLVSLTLPLAGWIYFRVTAAPASVAALRAGIL